MWSSLIHFFFCFSYNLCGQTQLTILWTSKFLHKLFSKFILSFLPTTHILNLSDLSLYFRYSHYIVNWTPKKHSFFKQHVNNLTKKSRLHFSILFVYNRKNNLVQVLSWKRSIKRDQLKQNTTKHPHVCLRVIRLSLTNFWW